MPSSFPRAADKLNAIFCRGSQALAEGALSPAYCLTTCLEPQRDQAGKGCSSKTLTCPLHMTTLVLKEGRGQTLDECLVLPR